MGRIVGNADGDIFGFMLGDRVGAIDGNVDGI